MYGALQKRELRGSKVDFYVNLQFLTNFYHEILKIAPLFHLDIQFS